MNSSSWYARYPGDYLRDTAHLSLTEHGAYTLLLDHYYSTERLPENSDALYRICRALNEAEKQAVDAVLKQFFYLSDGGYHNKRADRELLRRCEQRRKLSRAGRRGVQARLKPEPKPGLSHDPSPNPSQAQARPQPQPQPQPEKSSSAAAALPVVTSGSIFTDIGISPCGPESFKAELERAWVSRNGKSPSEVIGAVIDRWEEKQANKKDRGCLRPLFVALAKMRAIENNGGLNGANHSGTGNGNRPAHGFFGEEERDWTIKVATVPNS